MQEIQQLVQQVLMYLRMIWRYRWIALIVSSLGCMGGWAYVMTLPDVYEVETKVFLDTRTMLKPLLKGLAVDSTAQADAELLMRRTLLVRPNLETVARKTDMDLEAKTPEGFERLLDGLARSINLKGTAKENIYVITYKNQDPRLATRVVESLLNIFVEKSLGESRKDSSQTKAFLAKQIAEYEARLDAAESRLKQFRQRNMGLLPSDGTNYFAKIDRTRALLQEAMLELSEADQRRSKLEEQLKNVDKLLHTQAPGAGLVPPDPMTVRIQGLEARLDELLLTFTDRHPDVVATKRVLESLRAQKSAAGSPASTAQQATQLQNPVYQELKVALSGEEATVAAIQARVAEYESRMAKFKELAETSLNVEAELKRLDRDYTVNKDNYEELLKRREALKISDEVSQTTDQVRFNILEPPRVPLSPVGPDRFLYNSIVLLAGLGGGVGIALLFALLRPTVYGRDELAMLSDLPVLGVVSRVWTPQQLFRRRMEVVSFAVAGMVLVAFFGGISVLNYLEIDVVDETRRIAERIL